MLPTRVAKIVTSDNRYCDREQFAVKLSYACTIHKSEGMTLEKARVDIGKNEKPIGLSYVAMSRVKRLQDLLLVPFDYNRLTKIKLPDYVKEFDRKTSKLIEKTNTKYKHLRD